MMKDDLDSYKIVLAALTTIIHCVRMVKEGPTVLVRSSVSIAEEILERVEETK